MGKTLQKFVKQELDTLEQKGLKRRLLLVEGPQAKMIRIKGKELLNFCSNNYLGLADDTRVGMAVCDAIKQYGMGSGASRLVCGNMVPHVQLEKRLADLKGTQRCLLFSTGYMANVGIISGLFDSHDLILADRLVHASIIDGILLSQAKFRRYAHNDMATLEKLLQQSQGFSKKVIITESVFSMDGDIAPLNDIVSLAKKYKAVVMVDEAHAFGVLGENGKGAIEHFGLEKEIDIQMGTLSKAVGVFGAYCCGSEELITYLFNKARSFIYTTGMPPSVAAAVLEAIEIMQTEPQRRRQLWENTHYLREGLKARGFNTLNSQTPIIPVIIGEAEKAVAFSQRLFAEGIFVQAIRPPTVPQGTARLRVTVMATHSQEEIDRLLAALENIGKELCLL